MKIVAAALPAVLGVLAGGAGSLIVSAVRAPSAPAATTGTVQSVTVVREIHTREYVAATGDGTEARPAVAAGDPLAGTRGTAAPVPADAPAPMSSEAAIKFAAQLDRIRTSFEHETVDRGWAVGAERTLRDGLSAVGAESGFALDAIECRTSMCQAKLSWDPSTGAAGRFGDVMSANLQPNCAMATRPIAARPGDTHREVEVLFDCAAARWPE